MFPMTDANKPYDIHTVPALFILKVGGNIICRDVLEKMGQLSRHQLGLCTGSLNNTHKPVIRAPSTESSSWAQTCHLRFAHS